MYIQRSRILSRRKSIKWMSSISYQCHYNLSESWCSFEETGFFLRIARTTWHSPCRCIVHPKRLWTKCLTSEHVLRFRPPTHWMQFALHSSAFIRIRLCTPMCICICMFAASSLPLLSLTFDLYLRSNASYRHEIKTWYSQDLSIKHIQESRKASQGCASSEHFRLVGGVSEATNWVPIVFLVLEKLLTRDKDWRGERLKAYNSLDMECNWRILHASAFVHVRASVYACAFACVCAQKIKGSC